jgi:post-segregation antitoxin (ccd killing protein)
LGRVQLFPEAVLPGPGKALVEGGGQNSQTDTMNKNSQEYKNGHDAGLNGSNTTNTHFSNFATKGQTADWEAGNRAGKKAKANQTKGKGTIRKVNPRRK